MSESKDNLLNVAQFTFWSLFFCGTRIDSFRGPELLKVINRYYMPFIRRGWGVPLAFILDICSLLLRGGVSFTTRWKVKGVPPELQSLANDYYRLLQQIRGNPTFQYVTRLVRTARHETMRDAAITTFLRFLIAEFAEMQEIVTFKDRRLVVEHLRPRSDSLDDIVFVTNKRHKERIVFDAPHHVMNNRVIATIGQVMRHLTDYYRVHSLDDFISSEERFMIHFAACSHISPDRVDYHQLHRMLLGDEVDEPEVFPPLNDLVEELTPTESYQVDGRVGGYIDINQKKVVELNEEILPSEFALIDHEEALVHKMMNEGMLHYIREDIEQIEPQLRVLVYFVVDTSRLMLRGDRAAHPGLPQGLTPAARGKAIVFDMLRDLARYMPRENVHMDAVIYLWNPEGRPTWRDSFPLFDLDATRAASRYLMSTDLAERIAGFFPLHLQEGDQPEFVRLLDDPYRNFERMSQEVVYHCRHVVLASSSLTRRAFLPAMDLNLMADEASRDSLWILDTDTTHLTVGIQRPTVGSGNRLSPTEGLGQLTEQGLRDQFLQTVLLKAAARRPQAAQIELGDRVDG